MHASLASSGVKLQIDPGEYVKTPRRHVRGHTGNATLRVYTVMHSPTLVPPLLPRPPRRGRSCPPAGLPKDFSMLIFATIHYFNLKPISKTSLISSRAPPSIPPGVITANDCDNEDAYPTNMIYSFCQYITSTARQFIPNRSHQQPVAQRLPQEVLLEIFRCIPFVPAPYRDTIVYPYLGSGEPGKAVSPADSRAGLPLICRKWNGPATEVLYEEVEVSSLHAARILLQTLQTARGPALGEMIKTLRLPARADVGRSRRVRERFPNVVAEIMEGIVSRCSPALKSLTYSTAATEETLGMFWEPRFSSGTMLTDLHLSNSYSVDDARLPPLEAHRHLRSATLTSFIFDRPTGMLQCPASLESLTLNSCIFNHGWDIHHPDPAVFKSLTFNICTFIESPLPAHLLKHIESLEIYLTPSLTYDLSQASNLKYLTLAPAQSTSQFGWTGYVPHGLKRLILGVFDPHDIQDLEALILPLARELELVQLYICCKLGIFERECLDRIISRLGVEEIKVIWESRVDVWRIRQWLSLLA